MVVEGRAELVTDLEMLRVVLDLENEKYDTSYGIEAREAVKWSPREFAFVLEPEDCKKEADRVTKLLWPYNYSQQEIKEAEQKLGTSRLGKGSLIILDSKISPAAETASGKDWGQIDWLKFQVQISIPRGGD